MATIGYKTLRGPGSDEFIIQKSRFLGHAAPVGDEAAALAFLAEKRQQYRDASHNCYAYVIGRNAGIMRYSDDGEPGGTAGLPIMEVLKARGVVDCVVVVTRYFGGVLLGAGGLVRAYTQGCAIALDAAGVVIMQPSSRYWIEVDYPLWDRVAYALEHAPVQREETEFAGTVTATLLMRDVDVEAVLEQLKTLTDGRVETLCIDQCYHPWPDV